MAEPSDAPIEPDDPPIGLAKFQHTGDWRKVYSDLCAPSGSTIEAAPGEKFYVGSVVRDIALLHPELKPIDGAAKKLVADARRALKEETTSETLDQSPEAVALRAQEASMSPAPTS